MLRLTLLLFACVIVHCQIQSVQVGKHEIRIGGPSIQVVKPRKHGAEERLLSEIRVKGVNLQQLNQFTRSGNEWILEYSNNYSLKISQQDTMCTVLFHSFEPDDEVELCHPYGNASWYGGAERWEQLWPVQSLQLKEEPFITTQVNNQGVVESYWVNSAGDSIFIRREAMLFVDSNNRYENELCLISRNGDPYIYRPFPQIIQILCSSDDVVAAQKYAINSFLGKPTAHPSEYLMKYPIYSTWVRYKAAVNQTIVKQFTDEIYDRGFLPGQIEIDDKWEPCYGALVFDTDKFPNITELVDYIHSKGATASLWIHPFVNVECEDIFAQYNEEGRFIKNQNGSVITPWWNGQGAAIDITNETTRQWWIGRLQTLQKTSGLDGFKFDAGETGWLPQLPQITSDPELYPDSYATDYLSLATLFGTNLEARVGHQTQNISIYIRMLDKDSRWGLDNGLQSVITTSFQMGITGYPFILPDMIGGNQYGEKVSKELFIRWHEASALLPAVQFSVLPWDYDEETANISMKYLKLREKYIDYLLQASNKTIETGQPLISPIWWIAPNDNTTFDIIDEYLVGSNLLVAPVLEENVRERKIYLPEGKWLDKNTENILEGPIWIEKYSVPLDALPLFEKV